ncbi:MAG: hypothetical protein ABJ242_10770 [Marinomonas sp.]
MPNFKRAVTGLVAAITMSSIAFAAPVAAQAEPAEQSHAEIIRKLNIMLMVTSLRCRVGAHDFQAEYERFTANYMPELQRTGAHLRNRLEAQHGKRGGRLALDRIGVGIAKGYGGGHPWLNCEGLKSATAVLNLRHGAASLALAADELLSPAPTTQLAVR